VRHRNTYLFSGVLVCDTCNGPMTIIGGSSARYYACATNRTKGTCEQALVDAIPRMFAQLALIGFTWRRSALKEPVARGRILDAIRERQSRSRASGGTSRPARELTCAHSFLRRGVRRTVSSCQMNPPRTNVSFV
jgi:Recombinase zinc beta ribbon domain